MARNLFCMLVAALWLAVLVPLAALLLLFSPKGNLSIWVARRLWAPVLLVAGGARLRVFGLENVDPSRPTIYASNHQSTIDIPCLLRAIPVNLRFVAKKQLRWVPLLGWYMWLAGFIFVDRGNHRRAIASLGAAAKRIRAGTNIIVYPEGTRSPDGRILPFKKGPFALALKARVPICPVTIEGSGKVMPKNTWNITPGEVKVMIGKPIDTTSFGEGDRESLLRVVRERIIDQSLALGGKGGDRGDAVAARGLEGVGVARPAEQPHRGATGS
ncbi:MAG: 1-acyl-sn-glycerol-3-phosphate acyltransferase [Myxococcales bacterium]|nr:1-acyl-sn-glycerol-3-phosphate acyltransferase [Myxococcales bacterium]